MSVKKSSNKFYGAALLMATSAIGPGFITQTTVFTQQLFASFGFVILMSILLDLVAQLNIWRMIAVTGLRAPDMANTLLPGLGFVLVILVVLGGIVFNMGNIGGCGLGLNILLGADVTYGAMASCILAILIFLVKEFGKLMDGFAKLLGFVMIALTFYVAIQSHPPMAEIAYRTFIPEHIDTAAIVTLVGGTVGGYISFAGAHRMLDAAGGQPADIKQVTSSAITGIGIASLMRIFLFLAVAGVVATGAKLAASNPPASVFEIAAGQLGLKLFGCILWSAAITSVIGAAYTSVSFLETLHSFIKANRQWFIIGFIILSTILYVIIKNPVKILVTAGALNGLILPLSLSIVLVMAGKIRNASSYKHPVWLVVCGWIVVAVMTWMSIKVIISYLA
jgi:Mn2+/Fe2+ NRAMP family transporter